MALAVSDRLRLQAALDAAPVALSLDCTLLQAGSPHGTPARQRSDHPRSCAATYSLCLELENFLGFTGKQCFVLERKAFKLPTLTAQRFSQVGVVCALRLGT